MFLYMRTVHVRTFKSLIDDAEWDLIVVINSLPTGTHNEFMADYTR
jgi:hypothetical protein